MSCDVVGWVGWVGWVGGGGGCGRWLAYIGDPTDLRNLGFFVINENRVMDLRRADVFVMELGETVYHFKKLIESVIKWV